MGEINLNFVIFNFNSAQKALKIYDTWLTERVDLPTNRTGKADGAEKRKCKRRSKSESGTHKKGSTSSSGTTYNCKELYESLLRGFTKLSHLEPHENHPKMVGDTGWCEISNIKLQRYTDTGPSPGTRPQARDNGKFEISEIQDNEIPLYFFFQSPCEDFPCQHGGTCRAIYETGDYSCPCTRNYTGKNCEVFVGE